jgi:tetratricopeptide (TPR) repeat protein
VCSRTPCSPAATWRKLAMLLILMAFFVASATGQSGRDIVGQVRTTAGGPLPLDITVFLEEAEGGVVAQQFVGTDGKFEFDHLKKNSYRLVVTAKGFQMVSQEIDMNYEASRFPAVYLSPLVKKSTSPTLPTETATDLAAPRKARKEYEKGARALQSGNLEEARHHLERAVAEDPCYARAETTLGVTLAMQHELALAESAFNKSIKCDGMFLEAYLQQAILLNAQRKFRDSEATLRQGLRRFPDDWQLHYQLGTAEDGMAEYEAAEGDYLRAQSANPAVPPEFHLRLAKVYLNLKKYDKAHAEMETYLQLDPSSRVAEQTRRVMRQMETSGVVSSGQSRKNEMKP